MTQAQNQKFSYKEPKKALNSRIAAHAQYSNFNLHEWISEKFEIKPGDTILDVGCGNGNYTKVFWEKSGSNGQIIGLDKNENLIEEAKMNHSNLPNDLVKFFVHDFDEPFPELQVQFDWVFAIYSLYYTEDSLKLIEVLKSQLKEGGQFVVIGPAPENAKDLTEFSIEMTGVSPDKEHSGRIERIEKEFKPLFEQVFSQDNVEYEAVDSVMDFPTAESYAEYYFSTLLWRDSTKNLSEEEKENLKSKVIEKLQQEDSTKIRKQMSCLIGRL